MACHKHMYSGLIYKAVDKCYDENYPKYNCYIPCEYANGSVLGDCWVADENGNICPGYNVCGVPVCVEALGEIVGKVEV